jgi:site-specific DNA-methyltransferase (adenine-specific)
LKEYLHAAEGPAMQDVWTDIALAPTAGERLGYPTQKPVALLERIVEASSNEGDVVLDPFLGGGTTALAAQKLRRRWIGIDVTYLAIGMTQKRLRDAFSQVTFEISGQPKDLHDARVLFAADPHQFQWWAVSLIDARPYKGRKKGADQGIDGLIFVYSSKSSTDKVIVSVKGGGTGVRDIRDLVGVLDREKAPMGVFLTLQEPTGPMLKEAAGAGNFRCDFGAYPRVQIFTIKDLLVGLLPKLPPQNAEATMKKAPRESTAEQAHLAL